MTTTRELLKASLLSRARCHGDLAVLSRHRRRDGTATPATATAAAAAIKTRLEASWPVVGHSPGVGA